MPVLDFTFKFNDEGLILKVQLTRFIADEFGNFIQDYNSEITNCFAELGGGYYHLQLNYPDFFRGGVKVLDASNNLIHYFVMNPEQAENHDVKASSRLALTDFVMRRGVAQGGDFYYIILDNLASPQTSLYEGSWVALVGGTGVGQSRAILGYDGLSKVASIDPPFIIAPDNTTEFAVIPSAPVYINATSRNDIVNFTGTNVWSTVLDGFFSGDSAGNKMNLIIEGLAMIAGAVQGASPWDENIFSYSDPATAGGALAGVARRVASAVLNILSPVTKWGHIEIMQGDDYLDDNNRAQEFTLEPVNWTEDSTITLRAVYGSNVFQKDLEFLEQTETGIRAKLQIAGAETLGLATGYQVYDYTIRIATPSGVEEPPFLYQSPSEGKLSLLRSAFVES